mmetsp:Transcript_32082/g.51876  ORF Transcript_32082/g.51876 Transcript_32082/m.51876 type:complete len:232 (-) Transcript_32082:627-1322(-)
MRFLLNQIQDGLVVDERHVIHADILVAIHFLLQFEHCEIEQLLQFFVAKINAQLLQRIALKNLKAKNIEQTNRFIHGGFRFHRLVDLDDEPVKQFAVHKLDQRGSLVVRIPRIQTLLHRAIARHDQRFVGDARLQLLDIDTPQLATLGEISARRSRHGRAIIRVLRLHHIKLDIADMQNASYKAKNRVYVRLSELQGAKRLIDLFKVILVVDAWHLHTMPLGANRIMVGRL